MKRISLQNEMINEYLAINEEFTNLDEFCKYITENESTEIRIGLRKMLIELLQDKEEKAAARKRTFDQNVEWVKVNCQIGEGQARENTESKESKSTMEKTVETGETVQEVIPERAYDKIKTEFETNGYQKLIPLNGDEMDYSKDIVLHEEGIITQQNRVQIYLSKKGMQVDPSKMLIIEETGNQVLAMGYLIPSEKGNYFVVLDDKSCIEYEKFKGVSLIRFVLFDQSGNLYSREVEMEYQPFKVEKKRPLCIDFGTSNTTAGSYGILDRNADEPEIVHFIDVTETPNNTEAVVLPTIVYVEDCSDENHIQYLFGYEARRRIEEEHYESRASVFYEIKRWLSSPKECEEIRDNKNHKASPKRQEIIKAYLDYVIETAEQYFGTRFTKIHFTAPVKLKNNFIGTLQKLYEDEKVILAPEESIDEGIAIVYNQIITLLYKADKENQKKSIMIMDCGGGTTDLASCEYSYQKENTGIRLQVETCFENGNSNFGGNNITYRIMQMLKIKIASALQQSLIVEDGEIIRLIDKSENEILGLVERKMQKNAYDSDHANIDVYAKFLENYWRAESIIPTQYVKNQFYDGKESLKQVKRNFYYLWRQAEKIKIEFYKTERVLMDFKNQEGNDKIQIEDMDNYYLYVAEEQGGKLKRIEKPFQNISITIKEINRVICGDIYSLLVGLFQSGELTSTGKAVDSFDYYKLSGQSCKISLFSELIKEYIPGRKFRPAIEKSGSVSKRNSEDLKLDCVIGSINYTKDQRRPEMSVELKAKKPEIIYDVVLKGDHTKDRILFDCKRPNQICLEESHKNTREYPLEIVTKDGICERKFIFELRKADEGDEYWTTDEIQKKLKKKTLVDEEGMNTFIENLRVATRNQKETINIVFVAPANDGYGVYIGQIEASGTEDGSKYRLLTFDYENFEDASKTFFDGRR